MKQKKSKIEYDVNSDIRMKHCVRIQDIIMDDSKVYAFISADINDLAGELTIIGANPLFTGALFDYGAEIMIGGHSDADRNSEYGEDAD